MKRLLLRLLLAVVGVAASVQFGLAQNPDALAPSSITPKQVERPPTPPVAEERIKSPRNPDGDKPLISDKATLKITGIIIVKTRPEVQMIEGPATAGLQIRNIPFLDHPDFKRVITPFFSRVLTENAIRDLQDRIIIYCRERGKLLVDVILVPEQNIENGLIQLWFLEGKVGTVTVKNEGHKWFRDSFVLSQVRLRPGQPINSTRLSEDLNWLNTNPFRQVDVAFRPGGWPNSTLTNLGETDVELAVQDRLPVRPYVGYENTGTPFTGVDRLLFGVNWGNALGLDHQLSYQYSTDVDFDLVRAHSASYLIPLPWRHNLMFYGSYVDGIAVIDPSTSSEAHSWQASVRYSIPLSRLGDYRHELSVGFDFKRGNNDLLSGGSTVNTSDTDVAQFAATYTGLLPDSFGQTSLGLEFYYSPGDLTENNNDTAFNELRTDAPANYFYGRANIERITRLPCNFSWVVRGWGQLASDRLLPSEELALGGYNTVRGYDERLVIGDNGLIVNTEIRTPPWRVGLFNLDDQVQFLTFFDFGMERVIKELPGGGDGVDPNTSLYSAGVGLRYTITRYFSFRFDYGVPLNIEPLTLRGLDHDPKFHFGVLLSY